MPVQAQLGPPRRVAAHLQEQRPEVLVIDVEIVVVHVDGLVARELEPPVDLLALERLRLLLCDPDEHDPVTDAALPPNPIGDIVLPLLVVELVNRNPFPLRHRLHGIAELLGHLPQHHRRRDRLAQLLAHERDQPARRRQRPDVPIQVQPVQTFHFQRDVSTQQFRDVRHARDSTESRGRLLVGLRSKTSLGGTPQCEPEESLIGAHFPHGFGRQPDVRRAAVDCRDESGPQFLQRARESNDTFPAQHAEDVFSASDAVCGARRYSIAAKTWSSGIDANVVA